MAKLKDKIFYSNKTYEIPEDYINGYFLFSSEQSSLDEAELNIYETYPPKSWYTRERGYFGCVKISSPNKYIRLEKGRAVYYGTSPFELYEILSTVNFNDENFHQNGMVVMDNEISTIKVMQRIIEPKRYFGDSIIEVYDQFLFSINDHTYWGGFIENLSFKSYSNIMISLYDKANKKDYVFGEDGVNMSNMFSVRGKPIILFRVGKKDFFTIELPSEVSIGHISVSWLQPSSGSKKCFPINQSIDNLYREEHQSCASQSSP